MKLKLFVGVLSVVLVIFLYQPAVFGYAIDLKPSSSAGQGVAFAKIDFSKCLAEADAGKKIDFDSVTLYQTDSTGKRVRLPFRLTRFPGNKCEIAWRITKKEINYSVEFSLLNGISRPRNFNIPLLMNGDQLRGPGPSLVTPPHVNFFGLAYIDINGDGTKELLTGSYHDFLTVYENVSEKAGEIAISDNHSYRISDGWRLLSVFASDHGWAQSFPAPADYNGDNVIEIIMGGRIPGILFYIKPLGQFGKEDYRMEVLNIKFPVSLNFLTPAAGDLDGDGKPDLVIGSCEISLGLGNLYFLKNITERGASLPQFAPPVPLEAEGKPVVIKEAGWLVSPTLADLNGDGLLDVYYALLDKVYVLKNVGTPQKAVFKPAQIVPGLKGWSRGSVGFADIDNDGLKDALIGAGLQKYRNIGEKTSPRFDQPRIAELKNGSFIGLAAHNTIARFRHIPENRFEILYSTDLGFLKNLILEKEGDCFREITRQNVVADGQPIKSFGCSDPGENNKGYPRATTADFDKDGVEDLIVNHENGWRFGHLSLYRGKPNGQFSAEEEFSPLVIEKNPLHYQRIANKTGVVVRESEPLDFISVAVPKRLPGESGSIEMEFLLLPKKEGGPRYLFSTESFSPKPEGGDIRSTCSLSIDGNFCFVLNFGGTMVISQPVDLETKNWYKVRVFWDKGAVSLEFADKKVAEAAVKETIDFGDDRIIFGSRRTIDYLQPWREYADRVASHKNMFGDTSLTGLISNVKIFEKNQPLLSVSFDGAFLLAEGVEPFKEVFRAYLAYRSAPGAADLDGDGKIDLIAVTGDGTRAGVGTVYFFKNISTPGHVAFAPGVPLVNVSGHAIPMGERTAFAFGDFRKTGVFDMFVHRSGTVDYFRNAGTKTVPRFENPYIFATIPSQHEGGIWLYDLDGDGWDDVLVSNGDVGTISVFHHFYPKGRRNYRPVTDGASAVSRDNLEEFRPVKISSSYNNGTESALIDNNLEDDSSFTASGYPGTIDILFAKSVTIEKIEIYPGQLRYGQYPSTEQSPKDIRILYDDSGIWKEIARITLERVSKDQLNNSEVHTSVVFKPVRTKVMRLVVESTNDPGTRVSSPEKPIVPVQKREFSIRELKFYGR